MLLKWWTKPFFLDADQTTYYVRSSKAIAAIKLPLCLYLLGSSTIYLTYNVHCIYLSVVLCNMYTLLLVRLPAVGAVKQEIQVPSGENTELECSPFKAWSRSVYSHTCYAYCQGFLPCLLLPFQSVHLHFSPKLSQFFLCWLWLKLGSCVGPQNETGHPARGRFLCWVPAEYK